ncbi:MAG: hypothetical protein ACT4NY_15130 [Pseudonocardiales bacterium]
MVFNGGLWGLVLWLAVIGAFVLLAILAAWMVQARARRIPPNVQPRPALAAAARMSLVDLP